MQPFALKSLGVTDIGRRRSHNEDSFLCDDQLGLYVVADGVGGQAKGEIASHQATEEVQGFIKREHTQLAQLIGSADDASLYQATRIVESAVQSACYMVFGMAELDPQSHGMSTTISVLFVHHAMGIVAQVGDSRIYRLRDGIAQQLTEDHTLLNYKLKHGLISADEAANSPAKNVITRAVGHKDYVQVDTRRVDVAAGDRFLLCSDGLHGYIEDEDISPRISPASIVKNRHIADRSGQRTRGAGQYHSGIGGCRSPVTLPNSCPTIAPRRAIA